MNHTPHILASVFLCGLWLPVWVLTAAFYNAKFHCSKCGATPQFGRAVNQGTSQEPSAIAKWFDSSLNSLMKAFKASAIGIWFFSLNKFLQIILGGLSVFVGIMVFSMFIGLIKNVNRQTTKSQMTANNNSSQTPIASTSSTPPPPMPSSLSSTENLALGKKALSDGNLSAARGHLSAIPKEAKEFASAKQYLATVERREKRKAVEDELQSVKSAEANQEDIMNRTEHMEGSMGRQIYANALKRKAELQLQRIKLERKLKGMP